jgi:hypothetical protein
MEPDWRKKMARNAAAEAENAETAGEERRVKAGFLISQEHDFKLSVLARRLKKSRSDVIDDALADMLRHIVISFRNNSRKEGEAA